MGITGTNDINLSALMKFKLFVYAWAQKNWIAWDGPYQSQCTKWSTGYLLLFDSKAWVSISSLKFGEMNISKFITGWVWCAFAILIFIIFIIKNNRQYIFISNFHLILITFMILDSEDFESKSFLSPFYFIKGDFSIIDDYIPLSRKLWTAYKILTYENKFELVCKSTIINFIWIEIFVLLAFLISYIYWNWKTKIKFRTLFVSFITSRLFNALALLILPFEFLSTNLEIRYLSQNFNIKQLMFLLLQLSLIMFLFIIRWRHREINLSENKIEHYFAILFLIQLIICSSIFIDSLYKILFLFGYILWLQYIQNKITSTQVKLMILSEFINKVMLIIFISINLMTANELLPSNQKQGTLMFTIGISYMLLLYVMILAYIFK